MYTKGIIIHATWTVLLLFLLIFFSAILIFGWLGYINISTNQFSCSAKYNSYCIGWWKNNFDKEPFDWNIQEPTKCEKVNKPSIEDCKALVGIK